VSKTSDLRRQATEAVRAKQFDRAVELYERLCSQDAGNGTPRNELGDVFLKTGDIDRAIASFQEAARLYLEFGLTNNAVAVHKKILRHDPNHLHSLWVLGEIRLDQGLEAEASAAFLDFLSRHPSVVESEREAFVARGLQLLELMGDDPQILSALDTIFAQWDFGQDRARVLVAKARLAHQADEVDVRDKYLEHARAAFEHLDALSEYSQLQQEIEGVAADPDEGADFESDESGTIVLGEDDDDETRFDFGDVDAPVFDAPPAEGFEDGGSPSTRVDLADTEIDLGFDFDMDALSGAVDEVSGSVEAVDGFDSDEADTSDAIPEIEIPDDEGTDLGSDAGDEPDESDESIEIVRPFDRGTDAEAEPAAEHEAEPAAAQDSEPAAAPEPAPEPERTVDLLDEILADGGFDVEAAEKSQVDTITQDVEGQIAGEVDPEDHAGQYELGMVYLDLALYEQAMTAFDLASEGDDERLRALEMKGTCLLRLDRVDEAMAVFQEGLAVPGYPGQAYLGLLYGVGLGHESRGDLTEAMESFERVRAVDADFLDVEERLNRLRASTGDPA
jgi:tetratricopeptide (TPR) repeat protein